MKLFLEPMPGKLIVQEDEFVYTGMIKIPDAVKRKPTTGTVVAIGKGVEDHKIGDHLVYGQFSGTLIQFRNKPAYRILLEEEILAKIIDKNLEEGEELELEGVGT